MTRFHRAMFLLANLMAASGGFQASCQDRQVVPASHAAAHSNKEHKPAYYALVIGIDHYQHLPQLNTPINDAKEIAEVLRDQYRFQIEVLIDPTRRQILDALDHYREVLKADDNLLLYYAGHGYFDPPADLAYWAPADAEKDSHDDWIVANEITGVVRATAARHVLIISDSCYGGMMARAAKPLFAAASEHDAFLAKMIRGKSRHVMSSGGNEPVLDSDSSGSSSKHSVFADVLLQGLRQFDRKAFSAEELFSQYVRERVGGRSNQVPEFNPIINSGDEDGDFVFLPSGNIPRSSARDRNRLADAP